MSGSISSSSSNPFSQLASGALGRLPAGDLAFAAAQYHVMEQQAEDHASSPQDEQAMEKAFSNPQGFGLFAASEAQQLKTRQWLPG